MTGMFSFLMIPISRVSLESYPTDENAQKTAGITRTRRYHSDFLSLSRAGRLVDQVAIVFPGRIGVGGFVLRPFHDLNILGVEAEIAGSDGKCEIGHRAYCLEIDLSRIELRDVHPVSASHKNQIWRFV